MSRYREKEKLEIQKVSNGWIVRGSHWKTGVHVFDNFERVVAFVRDHFTYTLGDEKDVEK